MRGIKLLHFSAAAAVGELANTSTNLIVKS